MASFAGISHGAFVLVGSAKAFWTEIFQSSSIDIGFGMRITSWSVFFFITCVRRSSATRGTESQQVEIPTAPGLDGVDYCILN